MLLVPVFISGSRRRHSRVSGLPYFLRPYSLPAPSPRSLRKMSQDMQATASSSAAAAAASPMPIDASSSQVTAPAALDEGAKKDRALAEFMLMLDDYEPLVSLRSLVRAGLASLIILVKYMLVIQHDVKLIIIPVV